MLLVLQGTLRVIRTQWGFELGLGELRRHVLAGYDYKILGIVSILLGATVIVGSLLVKQGRKREGGITVIAFSALSICSGGGYYAALILGIVGGALAISEYKHEQNSLNKCTPKPVLDTVKNKLAQSKG
jgi:hypothetical protein